MPRTLTPTDAIEALTEARERTLTLVAGIGDEDLERVHSTLMSPLVWDLGHIAAFEDLWLVHRLGGEPMLRADLAEVYDAFETPRAGRGELAFLRPVEANVDQLSGGTAPAGCSEVFFGGDYRVLRGGSWATAARVVSPTFRNWDYPQRRQIFAGVRVAADA